jgi:hypothetical protein
MGQNNVVKALSTCRLGPSGAWTSIDGTSGVLVQTRGIRACVSDAVRYRQAQRIAFQIAGAVPP